MLKNYFFNLPGSLALLMISTDVMAKADYTYVKASLAYPWFMFFVFMVLVSIPFIMIIFLSWKKHLQKENNQQQKIHD